MTQMLLLDLHLREIEDVTLDDKIMDYDSMKHELNYCGKILPNTNVVPMMSVLADNIVYKLPELIYLFSLSIRLCILCTRELDFGSNHLVKCPPKL